MNDTSKPTPGPWHVVCTPGHNGIGEVRVYSSDMGLPIATVNSNWPGRTVDAAFIAEAGTVYHETNLTPRQLLEQRDEYRSLLHRVFAESFGGYISWEGGDTENVYHIPCKIYDEVESALAKCGKVGG